MVVGPSSLTLTCPVTHAMFAADSDLGVVAAGAHPRETHPQQGGRGQAAQPHQGEDTAHLHDA